MTRTGLDNTTAAAAAPSGATAAFDVDAVRADFPILDQQVHGKPLVYLDNAASSQKPLAVIEAIAGYYRRDHANVHRGLHALSERATAAYEEARGKVARFINAPAPRQVVFTKGCTEAINLVAHSFGLANLGPGDEVLLTHMEHHSNIVPWQIACEATGATLRVAPVDDRGELRLDEFEAMLSERTKVVAAVHVSNTLGTINPVQRMTELAHAAGAVVLIDGAQAVAHMPIDVQSIGCDFYAFSGHKMFGPTGVGALWGRQELLEAMPPYQGGGEMIESVTFDKTVYAEPPMRFEAGTPPIAEAIGLGAAVDYLESIDMAAAMAHEQNLLNHGRDALLGVPGLRLVGDAAHKSAVLSFVVDGMHPYDMAPLLDREGVAVRTGHHCTQPLMERFGVNATVRASMALYNRRDEIDRLIEGIEKSRRFLA